MSSRQHLLQRVEAYLASSGMSEWAFGMAVAKDNKLVKRLREGNPTLKLVERTESFLAERSDRDSDAA